MLATKKRTGERILVVDDSEDNLYLMQFILESQGYKVCLADNGKDAIKKLRGCHHDLILLDVMMPNMNGYEVISRLREDENLFSITIYLVTADKYIGLPEAIAAGANGLIHKPIDIDKLLPEIEQALN